MSDHPIPTASMQRIRLAYQQFEQVTQVVAEAMGIDGPYQIDMQGGRFVVPDPPASTNGVVADTPVPATID